MKRILVALVGLFLLAGCSQMDSAASVGKTEIKLETLQSRIDSILAERSKVDTSQMQLENGDVLTRSVFACLSAGWLTSVWPSGENPKALK